MLKFENEFEKREQLGRRALLQLKEIYPNYFKHEIKFSTDKYSVFDAFYFELDDNTHSIKNRCLIEVKLRDRTFDSYCLESKKYNSLLKKRKELGFDKDDMKLIYLCFCPEGTYLWNLDNITLNYEKIKMNKATSVSRNDKIEKINIMLDNKEAKFLPYKYNENFIMKLIESEKLIDVKIKEIKKGLENLFE